MLPFYDLAKYQWQRRCSLFIKVGRTQREASQLLLTDLDSLVKGVNETLEGATTHEVVFLMKPPMFLMQMKPCRRDPLR